MTAVTMASFDPVLCRVVLNMAAVRTALGHDSTGYVYRSTDQIQWTQVRGAAAVPLTLTAASVSDYEFAPDVVNYYGVNPASGGSYTDSITPSLPGDSPWLKNVRFPFLNQAVKLSDAADITRTANGTVFTVLGRSKGVAIATVRSARATTITVQTETDDDNTALQALLSTGDVLLLQVPAGYATQIGGYYAAGDTTETRNSVVWPLRWTAITVTEVEPPDASVAPIVGTWETVTGNYATWSALVTDLGTWGDVVSLVGAPADVVVD